MKRFLNFLTILGLLLIAAGIVVQRYEASHNTKYQLANGTVTEVTVTSLNLSTGDWYFCPKIEFITADERNLAYYARCTLGLNDYKKGQQFEIYYDLLNPSDAYLKGMEVGPEWFEPEYSTFLSGLGVFMILAGVLQTWWIKRKE